MFLSELKFLNRVKKCCNMMLNFVITLFDSSFTQGKLVNHHGPGAYPTHKFEVVSSVNHQFDKTSQDMKVAFVWDFPVVSSQSRHNASSV